MAKHVRPASQKPAPAAEKAKRSAPVAPIVPKPEKKLSKAEAKPPPPPANSASDDLQVVFGENLRAARLKSGLKQSDIAERTGLAQSRLSVIESGKHALTLTTMMRLAEVVNCSVSAMLLKAKGRPPRT